MSGPYRVIEVVRELDDALEFARQIHDMNHVDGGREINGKVPLAEMFGYSSTIRSLTTGRGSFLMQPAGYQPLSPGLAEPIVKARREFREKQKK